MYGHERIKALIAIVIVAAALGLFAALAEAASTTPSEQGIWQVTSAKSPDGHFQAAWSRVD